MKLSFFAVIATSLLGLSSAAFCTAPTLQLTRRDAPGKKCGLDGSGIDEELRQVVGDEIPSSSARSSPNTTPIVISTYVHIVGNTIEEVNAVASSTIQQQIATMNKAYSKTRFSFRLDGTDRTNNTDWTKANPAAKGDTEASKWDKAMKKFLRKGSYTTLNLYFQADLLAVNDFYGYSSWPPTARSPAAKFVSDGCNIDIATLPGSINPISNLGMTAVHEVGHWLGLLHVFDGNSCSGMGDWILDTPMQRTPTYGCPSVKKTCDGVIGNDSIHNFMDYSDDYCVNEFTSGQIKRMNALWRLRTTKR